MAARPRRIASLPAASAEAVVPGACGRVGAIRLARDDEAAATRATASATATRADLAGCVLNGGALTRRRDGASPRGARCWPGRSPLLERPQPGKDRNGGR